MHGVGPPRNLFMLGMGHTYPVPYKEPIHIVTTVLSTAFRLCIRTLQVRGKSSEKSRFQFCFNKKQILKRSFFPKSTTCPSGKLVKISTCPTEFLLAPGNRASGYFEPCEVNMSSSIFISNVLV